MKIFLLAIIAVLCGAHLTAGGVSPRQTDDADDTGEIDEDIVIIDEDDTNDDEDVNEPVLK